MQLRSHLITEAGNAIVRLFGASEHAMNSMQARLRNDPVFGTDGYNASFVYDKYLELAGYATKQNEYIMLFGLGFSSRRWSRYVTSCVCV